MTYLPDGAVEMLPGRWFVGATATDWAAYRHLIDAQGFLIGSVGSFLVDFSDESVLIDAGFGPRTLPASQSHAALGALWGGALLGPLEQLAAPLSRIAFTHLHEDHTGWLSTDHPVSRRLRDAELIAGRADIESSSLPLSSSNWNAIDSEALVRPGLTAIPTPGHTSGHTSYLVESEGYQLLIFGDVMHSPVQVQHPHWSSVFDTFPAEAVRSRLETIDRLGQDHVLGAGGHFADVVFGTVAVSESGRLWAPALP